MNDAPPASDPAASATPTGPVRTTISNGYRIRLALIGAGLTGFGCWALYDGFIAYPRQNEIYAEFEQFKEDNDDWQTSWAAYADERGYQTNYNKLKQRGQIKDIAAQYLYAGLTLPFGLWFLYGFATSAGRWVEADDSGVRDSKGADLTWDQITGLDDARWKNKGIAYLSYDEAGTTKRVLLDDWKFQREPTDAIYKLAKARLSPNETQEHLETQETQESSA